MNYDDLFTTGEKNKKFFINTTNSLHRNALYLQNFSQPPPQGSPKAARPARVFTYWPYPGHPLDPLPEKAYAKEYGIAKFPAKQ
jgi:hypothetical protein